MVICLSKLLPSFAETFEGQHRYAWEMKGQEEKTKKKKHKPN